jgi:hypothetical protein
MSLSLRVGCALWFARQAGSGFRHGVGFGFERKIEDILGRGNVKVM